VIAVPERFQFLLDTVVDDSDEPVESRASVLRRRIVVAVVLVAGSVTLGLSLSIEPGDSSFYPMTFALAAVWLVGAIASGPIRIGCFPPPRGGHVQAAGIGIVVGLILGAIFVVGGLVTREIPPLRDFIADVLDHADTGGLALVLATAVVNGIAEELFFRGAVYSAFKGHAPVIFSTLIYVIATLASGNPMLGFAAILLGVVCALERRATAGVLAPAFTHIAWTLVMVLVLPLLF
jgi:membrane protease YdiL (CAAX protease family)